MHWTVLNQRIRAAVVLGVMLSAAGVAQGQSRPVDSPYLAEFLRRIVDPIRQGAPIDTIGLEQADMAFATKTYFATDGSFVAAIVRKDEDLQILSTASADENLTPTAPGARPVSVAMTKAELDAFMVAFLLWQTTTEGVTKGRRCADWVAPGTSKAILLQEGAAFRDADGRPVTLEVTVSNMVSAAAAERLKPIWLAVLVLKTGEEWRC